MYCYNCGTQLPDGSRFCPSCGAKLVEDAAPAASQVQENVYNQQKAAQQTVVQSTPVYTQASPAARANTGVAMTSIVKSKERPVAFVIISALSVVLAIVMAVLNYGTKGLSFYGFAPAVMLAIGSALIFMGILFNKMKGGLLAGAGVMILVVRTIIAVFSSGSLLRSLLNSFIASAAGQTANWMAEFSRIMVVISGSCMILPLIFIALYHLLAGKTFRNPMKIICGILTMISSIFNSFGMYSFMISIYSGTGDANTMLTIILVFSICHFLYWVVTIITLMGYTPFAKIRNY